MSISTNYSYQTQIPQNVMFKAEEPVTVVVNKAQPIKKDEKMSTAAKYMIGATALAGIVAAGIAARKGCFGEKIQKFLKTSSELKAEAEKKAKEKAEKEAKEKAEKAAREAKEKAEQKAKETKTTTSNNTNSTKTSTKSSASTKSSSGTGKASSSNSSGTTHTSSRKGTSRKSHNVSSSHTTNTTSTSQTTQNVTRETKPAVKPQISPELTEQLKVYEQLIPKLAEGGIKAEYFVKDGEIQAKYSVTENMCKNIFAAIEETANGDNSVANDVKERILKELKAIIRQDLQAIKTSGNPEIAMNEFNDRLQKYIASEMPESVQESVQKLGDKLKYWQLSELLQKRTPQQREELAQAIYNAPMERYAERSAKSAKESAQVFEEFFSAKENAEKEARKILKGIETSAAEAKEAQRKIDIAQASYNAPLERGLAHKSANESVAVFRKAGNNEYQVYYDSYEKVWKQAVKRKLTMKEVEKIMSEKIQEYVEKCGTFRKVNKDVVISGEPKKIVYEGVQYDITDKGELLKKIFVPAKGKNNAIVTKYENTSEEVLDNILLQERQRQNAYQRRTYVQQRQKALA